MGPFFSGYASAPALGPCPATLSFLGCVTVHMLAEVQIEIGMDTSVA